MYRVVSLVCISGVRVRGQPPPSQGVEGVELEGKESEGFARRPWSVVVVVVVVVVLLPCAYNCGCTGKSRLSYQLERRQSGSHMQHLLTCMALAQPKCPFLEPAQLSTACGYTVEYLGH